MIVSANKAHRVCPLPAKPSVEESQELRRSICLHITKATRSIGQLCTRSNVSALMPTKTCFALLNCFTKPLPIRSTDMMPCLDSRQRGKFTVCACLVLLARQLHSWCLVDNEPTRPESPETPLLAWKAPAKNDNEPGQAGTCTPLVLVRTVHTAGHVRDGTVRLTLMLLACSRV